MSGLFPRPAGPAFFLDTRPSQMNAEATEVGVDEVLLKVQSLGEEQHAVVSIKQMLDCGASRKWIERRTDDGFIVPDGPAVYRMAGVRHTFLSRAMAAVLSCKAPALGSRRSAAHLLGFERVAAPRSVDLTAPRGEFARRRAAVLPAAGLPMPVFEYRVVVDGHVYYLDLAWPNKMVAVECNDAGSHDTPKAFRRDPMKRNRCERAGWDYLEY